MTKHVSYIFYSLMLSKLRLSFAKHIEPVFNLSREAEIIPALFIKLLSRSNSDLLKLKPPTITAKTYCADFCILNLSFFAYFTRLHDN